MNCDKCGQAVPLENDALALQFIREHGLLPGGMERLMYGARHLLPTDDCEGSPSRAQYLEGQPRDVRGYPYLPKYEAAVRNAFSRLQALATEQGR